MRLLVTVLAVLALGHAQPCHGQRIEPGTPPRAYAEVNDKLFNSVFVSWQGDNLMQRRGLSDPQAIEQRADELAKIGITGVEYAGRHFRFNWQDEWKLINESAARVVQACRERGILVVEHHDVTIPMHNGLPFLIKNHAWLQRDIRTGEPSRWFDPLHPEFLSYYINQHLLPLHKAADLDGYMLDEVTLAPYFSSASPTTEHTIKDWMGYDVPGWITNPPDITDAKVRAWLRWRQYVEPMAMRQIFGALRQIRPDVVSMAYCAYYSEPNTGYDLSLTASQFSNFVGYECIVYDALNGWQGMLRELKERGSLADYYHIPMWAFLREARTADSLYFSWVLTQLGRHSSWLGVLATQTPEQMAQVSKYARWPQAMPHKWARCLTDTAVLLSHQTRPLTSDRSFYWHDFGGWNSLLLTNNRQFDVLLDGDLQNEGRLGKYRTLILASQAALSDQQCRNLEKWVEAGGTCIFTRHTSLYDEYGQQRKDFALSQAANISFVSDFRGSADVKGRIGESDVSLSGARVTHRVKVAEPSRSEVLATATVEGQETPVVVSTRHGKGRFIYVAANLGVTQFQPELKKSTLYPGVDPDPATRAVMLALLDEARTAEPPVKLELPPGVVGTAYQLYDGPHAGDVYVQLANVRGQKLRGGQKSDAEAVPPFSAPVVQEPIRIHLALAARGNVEATSPKMAKPLTVKPRQEQGQTIVEIPGGSLEAYLQVRIPAERWANIVPPPVPLAIPEPVKLSSAELPAAVTVAAPVEPVPSTPASVDRSRFTVSEQEGLRVTLDGQPIIVRDELEIAPTQRGPALPQMVTPLGKDALRFEKSEGGWSGEVASGTTSKGIRWVREAATRGEEAEVSLAFRLSPVDHGAEYLCARHAIYVPVEVLRGAKYQARVGLHREPEPDKSGTFTGQEPENQPMLGNLRTIQFTGGKVDFLLEMNPMGPWGVYWDDAASTFHGHVIRQGDYYVFKTEITRIRLGGDFACKFVLKAGVHDIAKLHPVRSTHYASTPPASARVQFTPGNAMTGFTMWGNRGFGYDKNFEAAGLELMGAGKQMGWARLPKARLVAPSPQHPLGPIFSGGAVASGAGTFVLNHPNACVFASVLLAGPTDAEVRVEGGEWQPVKVEARQRHTLVVPVWIRDGRLDVEIRGSGWTLSGLVVSPLLYETEDYAFGRCWWALGKAPWQWAEFQEKEPWQDYLTANFGPRPLIP